MQILLTLIITAMFFTGALLVPFINLLYRLKFQTPEYGSVDHLGRKTLFNKLHGWKKGTPTGAGLLLIAAVLIIGSVTYAVFTSLKFSTETLILYGGLLSFGILGLYDDITKFFELHTKFWGLKSRYKFFLQCLLAFVLAWLTYSQLGMSSISLSFLSILGSSRLELGWFFVPIMAGFIVVFSNAFNITDGMDGLSSGLLSLTLIGFLVLIGGEVSETSIFVALLIGAIVPYLYFNIYPARVLMGDSGALAFGAILAVIAFLSDTVLLLPILGGVYLIEFFSSFLQIASFRLRNGKRILKIAPLHHHLEAIGWPETKVTMRLWLLGCVVTLISIFLGSISFVGQ